MAALHRDFPPILLALATAVAGCAAPGADGASGAGAEDAPAHLGADGKADGTSAGSGAYAALPDGASLEDPFAAMFCPDDPTVTVERELIDRVRAARRADPAAYEEGANPFRIRCAVYNLSNPRVVDGLVAAQDEGVDVQILIESEQLDPARDWNTTDEHLVDHGFELVADHHQLDERTRATADLVGIVDAGLMHLKVRLFETPSWSAALSGSMNPGADAVANEETLHLIRDPRLVARYAQEYDAVLRGVGASNVWDDGAAVNVLFTPVREGPRAASRMLRWIEDENEQILLMVFSLRDVSAPDASRSLVPLLAAKVAAGVPVYVITDRKQSDGVDADGNRVTSDDRTEDRLRRAGVHVYEAIDFATPFTAMHHKVAVLGRTRIRVITDSANWTFAALGGRDRDSQNVESVLFVDSGRLDGNRTGRRYLAQWMRVLERYADQGARDGEPPFATVAQTLTAQPGWPVADVTFVAADAFTSWGENVRVAGDLPELGAWDPAAALPLTTDAASYPRWAGGELALPLGVSFEWKLVAAAGPRARWESGANRRDRAQGLALVPRDEVTLSATWR